MIRILDKDKYWNSPEGVPSRLLSSRPETRGLHLVGALARPHREEQGKTKSKMKAYPDGCSRCQMRLGAVLEGVALSSKLRLDVQKRLVQRPCAASPHPPMGAALVASASGIAELAVPASRGRGAEVAFSRWRRVGEPT